MYRNGMDLNVIFYFLRFKAKITQMNKDKIMSEKEILENIQEMLIGLKNVGKFYKNEKAELYSKSLKKLCELYDKEKQEKQEKQKYERIVKRALMYLDYIDDETLKMCTRYDVNGIDILKI